MECPDFAVFKLSYRRLVTLSVRGSNDFWYIVKVLRVIDLDMTITIGWVI